MKYTQNVISTAINKVEYDSDSHILTVYFVKGNIYNYHEVPKSVFDKLVAAKSVGKCYNAIVRNIYN